MPTEKYHMAGFDITFDLGNDKFTLRWDIYDRPICHRWLEKLEYVKRLPLDDNRRFYGLPSGTPETVYNKICQGIHELNAFGIDLTEKIQPLEQVNNDWLNELHDDFTRIHGRDQEEKSQTLSNELVRAWNKLHINLHAMEGRLLNGKPENPRIVATWRNQGEVIEKYSIYDYDFFTMNHHYGEVFLNYRHVGKPPYEIYRNQDLLSIDRCVPSSAWCADFVILFYDNFVADDDPEIQGFYQWYRKNYVWFNDNFKFSPDDPRVGLGRYPLAQLNSNLDRQEIQDILSESLGICDIAVRR